MHRSGNEYSEVCHNDLATLEFFTMSSGSHYDTLIIILGGFGTCNTTRPGHLAKFRIPKELRHL